MSDAQDQHDLECSSGSRPVPSQPGPRCQREGQEEDTGGTASSYCIRRKCGGGQPVAQPHAFEPAPFARNGFLRPHYQAERQEPACRREPAIGREQGACRPQIKVLGCFRFRGGLPGCIWLAMSWPLVVFWTPLSRSWSGGGKAIRAVVCIPPTPPPTHTPTSKPVEFTLHRIRKREKKKQERGSKKWT